MALLANLFVRIAASTTDFDRGIAKAAGRLRSFGNEISAAGKAMTFGITMPLVGVGVAALKTAGEMEMAQVAFTTMMKSSEKAKAHLEELKKFTLVTPYVFGDLVRASRLMQAYGFAAEEVVPKLRIIGNAVSALGGGSEVLERVVRSMGEIGTRGKITGEQLRELSRAGIPAIDAIAQKLGVSVAEAQEKVRAGAVDAQTAMDALLGYMEKRFGGGMEAQSKTLIGMWSNLRDKITFALADIGNLMLPAATKIMQDFIDPVLAKLQELAKGFAGLPESYQKVGIGAGALLVAAGPLTWLVGSMVKNIGLLGGAINRLGGFWGVLLKGMQVFGVVTAAQVGLDLGRWLQTLTTDYKKAEQEIEKLNALLAQHGMAVERGTLPLERWAAAVFAAHDALKQKQAGVQATTEAVDKHAVSVARMMTLQELVNKEIGERHQQAIKKSVDAIADWLSISKPWGDKLELHAAQIDGVTLRLQLMQNELERAGKAQIQVAAPPDWSKVAKGTVLEYFSVMQGIGIKSHAQLRMEADRLGDAYERLVELQRENRATTLDVKNAYEAWTKAEAAAAGTTLEHAGRVSEYHNELRRIVRHSMDQIASGIVDVISRAEKLGEAFRRIALTISQTVLEFVIKRGLALVIQYLDSIISKLGSVGRAMQSWAGEVAGGAAGGGTAAAGAAGGAAGVAGGGLAGWIGAAAGISSAVTGWLGYFQGRRTEQDIGRIEVTSRGVLSMAIAHQQTFNQYLPELTNIHQRLIEANAHRAAPVTININGSADPEATARSVARHLKAMHPAFAA